MSENISMNLNNSIGVIAEAVNASRAILLDSSLNSPLQTLNQNIQCNLLLNLFLF